MSHNAELMNKGFLPWGKLLMEIFLIISDTKGLYVLDKMIDLGSISKPLSKSVETKPSKVINDS